MRPDSHDDSGGDISAVAAAVDAVLFELQEVRFGSRKAIWRLARAVRSLEDLTIATRGQILAEQPFSFAELCVPCAPVAVVQIGWRALCFAFTAVEGLPGKRQITEGRSEAFFRDGFFRSWTNAVQHILGKLGSADLLRHHCTWPDLRRFRDREELVTSFLDRLLPEFDERWIRAELAIEIAKATHDLPPASQPPAENMGLSMIDFGDRIWEVLIATPPGWSEKDLPDRTAWLHGGEVSTTVDGHPASQDSTSFPPAADVISVQRFRRCAARNALWLAWFEEAADKAGAFGAIRDRWNALPAGERAKYEPAEDRIDAGPHGWDLVRQSIKQARVHRNRRPEN